jgi:tRNA 2-thiouridine synthesizing protein A
LGSSGSSGDMENPEEVVDLRGLKCPLPALLARRRLARAAVGSVVVVLSDDPMAPIDIPHMCAGEGFDVIEVQREGDESRMVIRKA